MKRLICFSLLGSLFLLFVFHQILLTSVAAWTLHSYSISHWGQPLSYDKIAFSGNQLKVIHPQFENASSFTAEELILKFEFDWSKWLFHIRVEINQPHWHFKTPTSSLWKNLGKALAPKETKLRIHPSFEISSGILTWEGEGSSKHHLKFDLKANNQQGGLFKLYFDPLHSPSNTLELKAMSSEAGLEVLCDFQKVSCASLVSLLNILGISFQPWMVTTGSLHGNLKAIIPGIRRPHLEGEVSLEDFAFHHFEKELKGYIGQAKLKLEKNQVAYELQDKLPTINGKLDIFKPSEINFKSVNENWSVHQIEGSVILDPLETALIHFQAQRGKKEWSLEGKANLNSQTSLNLDLSLFCSSMEHPEGKIQLSLYKKAEELNRAKIQLQKLSSSECTFLQTLLSTFWPVFSEVKIKKGVLDAILEADITPQGIGEVHLKHFKATGLAADLRSWQSTCQFREVRGYGKAHLGKDNFWHSVHAGIHLEDGEMQFEGVTPHIPLSDIQAHLLIQQGSIEHSLVTLNMAGLKGNMDIEWGDHQQRLIFKLEGAIQDLADLFPNTLQEPLKNHFDQHRLTVLANLKSRNQDIGLDGSLHIQRPNTQHLDLIHFGCELKKVEKSGNSKYIPTGWFSAHHFPLDPFLSPLFSQDENFSIKGNAKFKGSFDDHSIQILYDVEDFVIDNQNLCLEATSLNSNPQGHMCGSYHMDLHTYAYQGMLPIQQGTYLEKQSGLIFQDVHGMLAYHNKGIQVSSLEAYCEDLYFSGDLELKESNASPAHYRLSIYCPTVIGKVSQVKRLLAQLDHSTLLPQIPLEGEFSARGTGLHLNFDFLPSECQFQTTLCASVSDGFLPFNEANMSLKGIFMDIDYDHEKQELEFSDIQGTLLVGKPQRVEEYPFVGHHLRFYPLDQPNIDLDLAVKSSHKELFRLVGHTTEKEVGVKTLHLNSELSHLSSLYPNKFHCQIKNWNKLEHFEFASHFDLNHIFQDLLHFRNSGFLFLSHGLIDKLAQFLPIDGKGLFQLQLLPDQSYSFQLEAKEIKQGSSAKHMALVKGTKQGKKWIIDQFQWDDWNIYGELQHADEQWKIPFLGLSAGDSLLLGLEGNFDTEEGVLQAQLKYCEMDLSKLKEWRLFQDFLTKWDPKGNLKAKGELRWPLLALNPWDELKASLITELTEFSLRDYPVHVIHPFQINLQGIQKVAIQKVLFEIPPQGTSIDLQTVEYLFPSNAIGNVEMKFNIPGDQMGKACEIFHQKFPEILAPSLKDILVQISAKDAFKGSLAILRQEANTSSLALTLDDSLYRFKNYEWELKKFNLKLAGDELTLSAFSNIEQFPIQVRAKTKWPVCQEGECLLFGSSDSQPCTILWQNLPKQGFSISAMQGKLGGCFVNLLRENVSNLEENWKSLKGEVIVDMNALTPLMPPSVAEKIKYLKLGSFYSFLGNFWMDPSLGNSLLETLYFKGSFASKEAVIKGFQVGKVEGDLQYIPGRLNVNNLSFEDRAGTLKVEKLMATLDQQKEVWSFFVPNLTVKNFRISRLRDIEEPLETQSSKFNSLIVKRIELQDFFGELNDWQSWRGKGSLQFSNPVRKNIFHPLFAIPSEILMRLGLDPSVLNPVTGSIYFNLQGDRFYLTRFKDVYSEGRGSKFYLAEGGDPSWMDLEGNLSVQVRMKQYNLMFKFAELFTVSVQGNLKKPTYSLEERKKS